MINIGILGSDNSHALAFAKLCNIADENGNYTYDDVRISAIYGFNDSAEHTAEVAKEGKIPFVVESYEDLFDKANAVMVVYRDGKYHLGHILDFIRKGYPVWIDKPVVTTLKDAQTLCEAAEKSNALVTGGSTMKYNREVLDLKNKVENGELGKITGGFLNFPANLKSEYSGLYFYASHLCEMCLSIFGYDAQSVQATVTNDGNFNVIVFYNEKQVVLNFNENTGDKYHAVILGSKGSAVAEFDISTIYKLGFNKFFEMIRERKMPLSLYELVRPVYMIDAILQSISTGSRTTILNNSNF